VPTADEARALALSLPEATEQDHHGRPSFRVRDRIFATLWTDTAMNVMAGEARILMAVDEAPDVCSEVHWGARLAAVRVELPDVEPVLLEDLLATAWARKAPKALVAAAGLPPR
jgi:hypothetical protein